jgi:ADP-ribose pyrophosphatase
MKQWKTLSKEVVFSGNKFLTVENHKIELPDGKIISDWPWVITPDYVNIVAVTENEKFIVFRQTKYAVSGITLAVIGGYIEPGELPLVAAKRELLEETGCEAKEWISLGSFPIDANRGVGIASFFLATGAKCVCEINKDDLEEQTLLCLSKEELVKAITNGEFKILPWVASLLLALQYLNNQK